MNKKLRPDVLKNALDKMPKRDMRTIDTKGGGAPVPSSIPKPCSKDRM